MISFLSKYRLTILSFLAAIVATIMAGCSSDENNVASQQGTITINVAVDGRFSMADGTTVSVPDDALPDYDNISVTLSDPVSGRTHTWESVTAFNLSHEEYNMGTYAVTLSAPGREGGPSFKTKVPVSVSEKNNTADITLVPDVALVQLVLDKTNRQISSDCRLMSVTAHCIEDFTAFSDTMFFVPAGMLTLRATIANNEDKNVTLLLPGQDKLLPATGIKAAITCRQNSIEITRADASLSFPVPDNVFSMSQPICSTTGFTSGEVLQAVEGMPTAHDVVVTGTAATPLRHVFLTMQRHNVTFGANLAQLENTIPECDLLHMSPEQMSLVQNSGLGIASTHNGRIVALNFSKLIEKLTTLTTSLAEFSVMFVDETGLCSEPVKLIVETHVMQMALQNVSTVVVGNPQAQLEVLFDPHEAEQSDVSIFAMDSNGKYTIPCPITSWQPENTGSTQIGFAVPEGTDDVHVAIQYMGTPRIYAVLKRVSPPLSLRIDAFASHAVIYVDGNNNDVITRLARININGNVATVSQRTDSTITIINLAPNTRQNLSVALTDNSPATNCSFVTESTEQLPSADWIEWNNIINYANLPCGGRYSATDIPIANRQNYANVNVIWPKKHWASPNAKTFCRQSKTHNTWFMQPSAVLETFDNDGRDIRLTSVGWDHNGTNPEPYIQKPGEQNPYSMSVPKVANRVAGRLWLGSYDFSPANNTESIKEGERFASRPSSINGYYKYVPDINTPTDAGYMWLKLVNIAGDGTERPVASASFRFAVSPDYKAFSAPIKYHEQFLKPTHIKLMFVSSEKAPEHPEYSEDNVPVSPNLANGAMLGSSLWLSTLVLGY